MRRVSKAMWAALVLGTAASSAWGQCDRWTARYGRVGGIIDNVSGSAEAHALTTWDPDGAGPLHRQLIVGGEFNYIDGVLFLNVARWDGVAWNPLGAGLGFGINQSVVNSLTTWDPDGEGPADEWLVLAGNFSIPGIGGPTNLATWDGASFRSLGAGIAPGDAFAVRVVTTFDFDGAGPLPAEVVAGGRFPNAEGQTVNGIARWNGTRWAGLGTGFLTGTQPGTVLTLRSWDSDGPGPLPARLVAGGSFSTSGVEAVNGVAIWDGTNWQALGAGFSGPIAGELIYALTTWDPDGDGPQTSILVAGGRVEAAGGVAVNNLAGWDGASWLSIGGGVNYRVEDLTTWDSDGNGPANARLVVNAYQMWDGTTWRTMADGAGGVTDTVMWDPDGPGPAPQSLYASSYTDTAGNIVRTNCVARWDGMYWLPLERGLNSTVTASTTWDPDGSGPEMAQLVMGGNFTAGNEQAINRIARWDGSAWRPFASGFIGQVTALGTWDADGDGPASAQLVAGGSFSATGDGSTANKIAIWNHHTGAWDEPGGGVSGQVLALTSWDADGPGGTPPLLAAGGNFFLAGGTIVNAVSLWDGTAWRAMAGGVAGAARLVYALASWDPDGSGPQPALLVVGGSFLTAGGLTVNRIAAWDGAGWRPLSTGMGGTVSALSVWDADGAGPQPALLVAGGLFTSAGGVATQRVAAWNGSQWAPIGNGLNREVKALSVWDADGPGSNPPSLIAGGLFTASGSTPLSHIAKWDGMSWGPVSSSMAGTTELNHHVFALTAVDAGDGGPPALSAGGLFTYADGQRVGYAAEIVAGTRPVVSMQPGSVSGCRGSSSILSVGGMGTGTIRHAWEWRASEEESWTSVVEGENASGTTPAAFFATGADSSTLHVRLRPGLDRLLFRAVLSGRCGTTTSDPATLTICVGDVDDGSGAGTCDGGVTFDDLLYYIFAFESGMITSDVDDGSGTGAPDGGVTIEDLLYFLLRFESGC